MPRYNALHDITPIAQHHSYNCNYNYAYNCTMPHYIATSENTTSATFRSIGGLAVPFVIHNSQPLLYVSSFQTSITALCGSICWYNVLHVPEHYVYTNIRPVYRLYIAFLIACTSTFWSLVHRVFRMYLWCFAVVVLSSTFYYLVVPCSTLYYLVVPCSAFYYFVLPCITS